MDKSKAVTTNLLALVKQHGISMEALAAAVSAKAGHKVSAKSMYGLFARGNPETKNLIRVLEIINEMAGTGYSLKDIDYL